MKNTIPHGVNYLIQGFQSMLKPGIRIYVILPIILNVIVLAALLFVGGHYFQELVYWLIGWVPTWLHWLSWLLWILFGFASLILFAFTYTFFANLIAAPFNGLLAEKVQLQLSGEAPLQLTGLGYLKLIPKALIRQLKILLYFLPRALGILILFLIPLIHIAAPLLWFLLTAWMAALQYIDYPMDNNQIDFKSMRQQMKQNRMTCLGFGGVTQVLTMVPILNVFVIPAAVIGATIYYCESQ